MGPICMYKAAEAAIRAYILITLLIIDDSSKAQLGADQATNIGRPVQSLVVIIIVHNLVLINC